MAHNRYFIINSNDTNINDIINVSVGNLDTQRKSLDTTLMVIKLHEGDHNSYTFLDAYTEYDHAQILPIMAGPDWQKEP